MLGVHGPELKSTPSQNATRREDGVEPESFAPA